MNGIRAEHAEASQPAGDRIAATLIPKAAEALRLLQRGTSLSKTDLANRAIILYQFVDDQLRSGHDIIARNQATMSLTSWVSPVAWFRAMMSWPERSWSSTNWYKMIARFARSVLDRLVPR